MPKKQLPKKQTQKQHCHLMLVFHFFSCELTLSAEAVEEVA